MNAAIATLTATMLATIGRAGRAPYLRRRCPLPSAAHSRGPAAEIRRARSCRARRWSAVPHRAARSGANRPGKVRAWTIAAMRREQISAREQQQRPRAGNRELRKQQDGGDQIVDGQCGLIARNECRDRGKRHAGKRHGAGEQHRRDADHGERGACDRGGSPAWSKERCCARHPLSSPANWQRTRHGNSFKRAKITHPDAAGYPADSSDASGIEAAGIAAPRLR